MAISFLWGHISVSLDRFGSSFPGANSNRFLDFGNEYFAVANAPCFCSGLDGLHRPLGERILYDNFELNLSQEVYDVFCATIECRMAFLPSTTLRFRNGNTLNTDLLQAFFHLIEFERFDDRFDLLHIPIGSQTWIFVCLSATPQIGQRDPMH